VDFVLEGADACVQLADHRVGADDGLTAAGFEFAAQEDDLLGQQSLDVAGKVHGVQGCLGKEPIDECVLFHTVRLRRPGVERSDTWPLRENPSSLRSSPDVTLGKRDSGYTRAIERTEMSKITVDARACIQCGACVRVCAIASVFEIRDGASVAVRPERCWGCGQCVSVCPVDAIDHDAFPLEKCPLVDNGRRPTAEQLAILMQTRRSTRTFAERPVPRDIVRDLVSASRWAPSAQNSQDVDWVAIDDRARIAEMSKATVDEIRRFSRLMRHPVLRGVLRLFLGRELTKSAGSNPRAGEELLDRWTEGLDPIFYNAPVVLVGHTRSRRAFARDDAIYAAYNLMLAAERQGLSTCQIGIFQMTAEHSGKVRRMLGLSEGRTAQVTLVLGYPLHPFRRLVPRRLPELVWNPR